MIIHSKMLGNSLRDTTNYLMNRLFNPMCGLIQQIGFIHKGFNEHRAFIAGVDLCGVHLFQNLNPPPKGSYHIGGGGVFAEEALIKCLVESVERYAQLVPDIRKYLIQFKSSKAMRLANENILSPSFLSLFSPAQFSRPEFPFNKFTEDVPLTWVKADSLLNLNQSMYIPMQLAFVGYRYKKELGEPWINSAVTTGTATHSSHLKAIKNAILELIQIDAAMGHWYTNARAYRIILDKRTQLLEDLIKRYSAKNSSQPNFYWLPSNDLGSFVIACVLTKKIIPYYVIGLGADTTLLSAMYKAYIEALGVQQLAKIVLINQACSIAPTNINENNIFNLEDNVALHAQAKCHSRFEEKFLLCNLIKATDLPVDAKGSDKQQVLKLLDNFRCSNKELLYLDLNTKETHDLNLRVARVWSPQLLPLVIPGAVPRCHPRFLDYGNVIHEDPHPYP